MLLHLKNIVWSSAARFYALTANLIFLWLTFRFLGPDVRGIFVVALTWVRLGSGLAHLSFGQAILHHAGQNSEQHWQPKTTASALAVCAAMTGMVWVIFAGAGFWNFDRFIGENVPPFVFAMLALSVPALIWEFYGRSLLVGLDKIPLANRAVWVSQTSMLLAMPLIFVFGIYGAVAAFLIGQAVNMVTTLCYIRRSLPDKIQYHRHHTVALLKKSLQLHPAILSAVLVASVDIVMIGRMVNVASAGYYQMAVQFISAMLLLPQMAAMVMFSIISKKGNAGAWAECRHLILLVSGVMLVGGVAAWVIAPHLIPAIFGTSGAPVVPIFQNLLWTLPGQVIAALMATQWIASGHFKTISIMSLGTAAASVALNMVLIPRYGVNGAIYAAWTVYAAGFVINMGFFGITQKRWRTGHLS